MENMINLNRNDPDYVRAIVVKKSQKDEKEIVIRDKISKVVLVEDWAKDAFVEIKERQKKYLVNMIARIDDSNFIHNQTQIELNKISKLLKSTVIEGKENLKLIPDGSPMLVMTNHFGAYKLTAVNPTDLGINIPDYDSMYPYLMYFAGLYPIAESTKNNLYYVSEDFPLVFGQIHTKAGFLHVPPSTIEIQEGRTKFLEDETKSAIEKHGNVAIVNFPEGGTSGKYSDLGPYDLNPFKTGGYVVAANLGMYVVPVAQYFDTREGFQLKVLEPFIPKRGDKASYENMANNTRVEMQRWLDIKKNK